MANKNLATRSELLDRWRGIEDEDDIGCFDPSKRRRLQQSKDEWFSDALNFLICLPKENHIWCGSWDLMGPLLDTFYNYFKDEHCDSPLKLLWKRISEEMRQCTQCICQRHKAHGMYNLGYESSSISPLLDILQSLDEERVTQHLKEINARIVRGEYDPMCDNIEVVSVMFEVLMYPTLLDDQSLVTEFQIFLDAINNLHEVTLAGHQQYPGVYALLFLKRSVRSIGLRLARDMGKMRRAAELECLQPFLKKCIGLLDAEVQPSTVETSRPRVQLERVAVWIGMKALLGFLESAAFEEGILERYPNFLSIVLNNISDDSVEFSYAVNCLRLLFEMLGCKLWLRTTLSPSVMRNTLLGQCFHTQIEKIHKEIFDLFQPFLQSLEALQDGEHEKQRRHFLYFLLHQVTVSSNFSILMRKMACQIALLIIHRGYKMNPPCPPFECAHMWGPSLVSSLKDSSLHISLRKPAFDLIQTIIVSDAAALITSVLNCRALPSINSSLSAELNDEEDDDGLLFALDVEDKEISSWSEFSVQSKTTSREYRGWICIPMLWFDVLVEINPSDLPISFSKAVFWALSRFSMVEPDNCTEMALPVGIWLKTCATEISALFGWKVPTGSDDGGDGKESKNSIKVSTMCIPLIRTFKRLTAHFVVQMEQGELWKQWTWEPRMGESLILLLLDPNDNVRQVNKRILEEVSNTRGLAYGLRFLCSSTSSLSAIFLGFRHALNLVQLDSVLLNFQTLHHFFFVLCKLLKEGSAPTLPGNSSDELNISKLSSQGGFLKQPGFDSLPVNVIGHTSNVDLKSWEKFSCLLSEIAWPSIQKCLVEGKAFVDYQISQMTCIRLLEILPVVFERLYHSLHKLSGMSEMMVEDAFDFKWFHDLMDWGKSSLAVIVRYWKQTVISLLYLVKGSCSDNSALSIRAIEKLISCGSVAVDELTLEVSRLAVSLSKEASYNVGKTTLKSKASFSRGLWFERKYSASDAQPFSLDDADVQILDTLTVTDKKDRNDVIVLSDDETEKQISPSDFIPSHAESSHSILDGNTVAPGADKRVSQGGLAKKNFSGIETSKYLLGAFQKRDARERAGLASQKQNSDTSRGKLVPSSLLKSKGVGSARKEINFKCNVNDSFPSQYIANLKDSSNENLCSKSMDQACNNMASETSHTVIKELVRDAEDDPGEVELKSVRSHQSCLTKPSISIPKRQAIQLKLPVENRSGHLHKPEAGVKRFKPPRLDDWYRPILEIDYFATVGLASASEDENQTVRKLKEVPVCFQSPDQYVDIFRPLVLEEFKAQLRSSFLEMSSSEEMGRGSLSVLSVERIDDFHLVRCVHDDSDSAAFRSCSENDLVLLTRQTLQNSSHDVHMVGKVERREKDNKKQLSILVMRFYLQNGSSRLNRARRFLIDRSKWYVSRLMSITPQLREFQALSSLEDIPILPIILKPINHSLGYNGSRKVDLGKLSQPLQRILKSSFNDSQLQAISVAIASPDSNKVLDLSLIQGPPGTGKTRTILAIVSGLLAYPLQQMNDSKNPLNGSLKSSSSSFTKSRPQISQSAAIARAWQDAALARQMNDDIQKNSKSMESFARGRILICAQSNAAVDELVSRISSEGLYGNDGKMYKPYLVRVGNARTVHPNSLPFFIDTLVGHRLAEERMNVSDAKNDSSGDSSMVLRSNLEKLVDRIRFYEAKRANLRDGNSDLKSSLEDEAFKGDDGKEISGAEIEAKLRKLYELKKEIYKNLSTAQVREKKANEESRALKHKLRKSILREAEIVVTTLSGCGGDLYGVCSESISRYNFGNSSEHTLFDAVVIDEAAQALEPATLIPLQLLKSNGTKCIMVGDPKQLPATVLSNIASKFMYQCSMFERLQRAGYPVIMLTEQYRMHPEICRFPSLHFYDRELLNGDQMSRKSAPFHETGGLGPYVFFDIVDGQELHGNNSGASSLYNVCEADAAVEVLRFFKRRYPSEFVGGRIGIITPYKCQLSFLRSRFSSAFGSSVTADMEFNTVDGFQGREVDILILSTVRAADPSSAAPGIKSSSIGFVADVRRMNVALTRAKLSLWILGNAKTLQTDRNWAALVKDARERNLVISVKMPYESMFKTDFRGNSTEISDNHSRQLKHGEKVKDTSQHVEQNKINAKRIYERKTKYIGSGAQSNKRIAGDEPDVPTRENVQIKKRRSGDQHDFSAKKDLPSIAVANSDNRISKDVKGKYENSGNIDHSGQETGDSHELLKSQVLKKPTESFDHDRTRRNREVSIPSTEGSLQGRDANDGGRAINEVDTPKDLIAKRKQQRDAVDALLHSALISSKKSETSLKSGPAKRPLSSTAGTRSGIKPPKPRKDVSHK